MLNIAICDDNIAFCSDFEEAILSCPNLNGEECLIDIYYTGETFLNHIKNKCNYDVIFLDIELLHTTGIEIGKYIREKLENEEVYIVYISSKASYAMELFQIRPLDFLLKPIDCVKLDNLISTLKKLIKKGNIFFECKTGYSYTRIPFKEIIYFESVDKKIYIHNIHHELISFYGKLNDLAEQLKSSGFLYIHKSYLINYMHTTTFNYDSVTMNNEITLPISQSKRSEIRKQHLIMRGFYYDRK